MVGHRPLRVKRGGETPGVYGAPSGTQGGSDRADSDHGCSGEAWRS
jgi:hypothetical protein